MKRLFLIFCLLLMAGISFAITPPVDPARVQGAGQSGKAGRDSSRVDGSRASTIQMLAESSTATHGSAVWFGNTISGVEKYYAIVKSGLTNASDSTTGYLSFLLRPTTTAEWIIEQFRLASDGSAKFWGNVEIVGTLTATASRATIADSTSGGAARAEQADVLVGDLDPDQLANDATDNDKVDSNLIPKVSQAVLSDSTNGGAARAEQADALTSDLDPDQLLNDAVDDNKVDSNLIPPVSRSKFADSSGAVDTSNATLQAYVGNHASGGDQPRVKTDSLQPLNLNELNVETGTGAGLKVLTNNILRMYMLFDSLNMNNRLITNARSVESDSGIASVEMTAPKGGFNLLVGSDTTLPVIMPNGIDIDTGDIDLQDQSEIGILGGLRWTFEATPAGTGSDYIHLPVGYLGIGTWPADNIRGISMGSNPGVVSDFGLWINQNDSSASYPCSINLNGTKKNDGTGGGDIYISWSYKNADLDEMEAYSMGFDASDSYRWKLSRDLHSLSTVRDILIADSLGKLFAPGGLWLKDDTSTTDNKAADQLYARTNGKQTEYIGITGGMVRWTPEPNATVNKFMTIPWVDTTSGYVRLDSLVARSYLWRVMDTTANNDTLFTLTEWTVDIACSLLTISYVGKTSSATAATSSLDSVIVYRNGSRITGGSIKPAFASTVLDTITIDVTDTQLDAGDIIAVVWQYVLTNDTYADCKQAAFTRRKR